MSEVIITDPETGGRKGQKPERFDLIPMDALEEVARVYGWGARKYADDNWLRGYKWRLSLGALLRHVARFMVGEDRDPESGLLHVAHAAWHCLTLATFIMRSLGTDDRGTSKPALVEAPVVEGAWVPAIGEKVRVKDSNTVGSLVGQTGYVFAVDADALLYGVEIDYGHYWFRPEEIEPVTPSGAV